jgi:phosphohistidine phosphatase
VELILWRHAEAAPGAPDMARALTERGRRQAENVAAFLAPRLPAGLRMIVSPARRAQETARALGRSFETVDAIAPGAGAAELLAAAGWPEANRAVLLVGHQPSLGDVAARLVDGRGASWNLGTGGIYWLRSRPKAGRGEAELLLGIEPEILERANQKGTLTF